jgi:hypothetical protein
MCETSKRVGKSRSSMKLIQGLFAAGSGSL